jgi:hypothetical protein
MVPHYNPPPVGGGGTGTQPLVMNNSVFNFTIEGGDPNKVGPAFMKFIRKVQMQTVGGNAPVADAMDWA